MALIYGQIGIIEIISRIKDEGGQQRWLRKSLRGQSRMLMWVR